MTPLVFWVRPEDSPMHAVRLMVAERIHRVVVLGEGGRLAGIVTSMDILKALEGGSRLCEGDEVPPRRHSIPASAIPEGWMADVDDDHRP